MALLHSTNTIGPDRAESPKRPNGTERLDGAHAGPLNQVTLDALADALSRMRYGAVHLTVHDGKIVQLDVTERQRFT